MKKYYSIYAAAALLLTACTQDFLQNGEEARDSKVISFSAQTVSVQDDTRSASLPDALPLKGDGMELWLIPSEEDMVSDATRGTQINSVEALSNFGVSAYRHGAIPAEKTLNEYLTDNNLKPDFFYNLEATKITDTQKFKLTKDFFWPTDDDVLSFFAYAPYGDENVVLSEATQEGPQSIDFKVNTVVKEQADFITAQASTTSHLNTSATPSVELNFTHQLTGIRFVLGDQFLKGWVKSISLKGVYTEGTYTIGGGWTLNDKKKGNFTISYNLDKPVAGDPGEEVSASDEIFMMIPHTFADDDAATIEVVYNDKYTDYIVSCPLKGQTWKAGKTVTYAITSNSLTTLRIGQIQFATTPEGAPKRIWTAGDKVGMYVVSSDGKKLKHKNVPVTYDGANWNVDHTTSEGTIYKLPGESFYFYYPYSTASNGQPTGYPEQCPELKASAPVFFEGVIDYFDYKKDQSTLANYLATDLQVARAEDDGRASMIKATMLRQVGLARFKFATSKTVYTKTFLNNTQKSSTATTIAPSTNFVTNKPYLGDNATYFFFTKANTATTFNSNPSDANHWKEAVVVTLGAGEYTKDANIVTVKDNRDGVVINNYTYNYDYQGTYKQFTMPGTGKAVMECWGAQGGNGIRDAGVLVNNWGFGGYTSGTITSLAKNTVFYIYVGQKGGAASHNSSKRGVGGTAGWNGGGAGSDDGADDEASAGGGGATDIRTVSGTWSTFNSLKSRIMVAGGGSGQQGEGYPGFDDTAKQMCSANPAGGLNGYDDGIAGTVGGKQTSGYKFGRGQDGNNSNSNKTSSGAGGGYYGGTSATYTYDQGKQYSISEFYGPGAGGSSFISGHNGCKAIKSSSTESSISHESHANHYSGYVFTSTIMIDGLGYQWTTTKGTLKTMPNPSGGNFASGKGNSGNGYCRITCTFE